MLGVGFGLGVMQGCALRAWEMRKKSLSFPACDEEGRLRRGVAVVMALGDATGELLW